MAPKTLVSSTQLESTADRGLLTVARAARYLINMLRCHRFTLVGQLGAPLRYGQLLASHGCVLRF